MRGVRATAVVLFCLSSSANADTIVQTMSGSSSAGTFLTLFDPSLGPLNSVQIEGTMVVQAAAMRDPFGDLSAISVDVTGVGGLIAPWGTVVPLTGLSGTEGFPEGSIFGGATVSGNIFSLLTGAAVNPFLQDGIRPNGGLWQPFGGINLLVGHEYIPGKPISPTYNVTVTYNFGPVPEPSTWAMMLLGFVGVGLTLRRRIETIDGNEDRRSSKGAWRPATPSTTNARSFRILQPNRR
jgi:hypothetical protein